MEQQNNTNNNNNSEILICINNKYIEYHRYINKY